MPWTPAASSAAFTSSRRCGWMIPVTSFMRSPPWCARTNGLVGGLAVDGEVDTADLDLFARAQAHRLLDREADDDRHHERVGNGDQGRHRLCAELLEPSTVEQTVTSPDWVPGGLVV